MSDIRRDRIVSGFNAGLISAEDMLGGVFVRKTKVQRNSIGPGYRRLDAGYTTLCYISSERALYELTSNPSSAQTEDSDWTRVLTVASGLTPLGVWNIDNVDPELQDDMEGMEDLNGNFYFVTGAATPTLITIPGLFGGQSVTVKDGDLVVSNGEVWFVNPINISWDTLDKPQVIIDYVNGTVIAHTHEIDDVNGLQDELDAKYDESDVAPLDEEFGTIPDVMLVNVGFLKQHYLLATDTYSKAEIDGFFEALEDYYTKEEIDGFFDAQLIDIQAWVNSNFYDKETVDAKIAQALDGVDGVVIGEASLVQRDAYVGGDTINGYTLAAGHRLIVSDSGLRYVDEFTGTVGQSGALFWTRIYQYDAPLPAGKKAWVDCGTVDLSVTGTSDEMPHPDNGHTGTGESGAVMQGNTFDVSEPNSDFSILKDQTLRALIDNPGKVYDPLKWKIMP